MLVYLVLLWAIDLLNASRGRDLVVEFGLIGRDPSRLLGILISPFLHGSPLHVVANASAIYTLGLVAGLYGIWRFLGIVAVIIVLGGFGLWVIAPANAVTVGSSGIVFGLFGYLLMRGLSDRRPVDIVVSLGVAVAFGYTVFSGVLPQDGHISWQGHLTGFIAGVFAAWLFRRRKRKVKPPADVAPATSPMDTNPTDTLHLPSTPTQ